MAAAALEAPITAPPAIQIPGSQWRMALKPVIPSKPSHQHPRTPSDGPLPDHHPFLPRSKTSRAGPVPKSPQYNNNPGSKPRSSSCSSTKTSHLDGEKWENCIRMQFALKPGCRKLLRKIIYIVHWKARYRKFEWARKGMGEGWRSVVNPNAVKWVRPRKSDLTRRGSWEGSSHTWQARRARVQVGNREEVMSRGHPPLLPPKPEGLKSWKAEGGVTRMSLDELERQWWGDGFPVYMSEEDRKKLEEGRECWLDEVD